MELAHGETEAGQMLEQTGEELFLGATVELRGQEESCGQSRTFGFLCGIREEGCNIGGFCWV